MTKQIVVRGKIITPTLISAFGRRIDSTDEIITQWANAGALELSKNKNGNWLIALFATKALRLNAGGLNKLGLEVLSYVQAHFPRVVYDKETTNIGFKAYNPESPLAKNFVSVGDTEIDEANGVIELNGKFYREQGDFALTFEEYKLFKAGKGGNPPDEKPVQAKAITKAVEKALAAQLDSRFIGAPDELVSAMEALGKLAEGIRQQISASNKAEIDAALAKLEAAKALPEPRVIEIGLALSAEETALIEERRAELAAASQANAQAETKAALKSSRAARNKAAQAVAETALTQEIKDKAASADAVQPQAKDVA